ncbi:MAG: chorismate mutase [Candidatus Riflebacteria bacterium]|nr:chorismate mutase [Candidatus Riflebacteria bacterium]
MSDMENLRGEIDKIDEAIINLIDSRAEIAEKIFKEKLEIGLPTFSPKRETQIIDFISKFQSKRVTKEDLRNIFLEIVSACRKLGVDEKLVIYGEKFGLSHNAARIQYGKPIPMTFKWQWRQVLSTLDEKSAPSAFIAFDIRNPDFSLLLEDFISGKIRIVSESLQIPKFALVSKSCKSFFDVSEILIPREFFQMLREWANSLNIPVKITLCNYEEEAFENLLESRPIAAILPQQIAQDQDLNCLQSEIIPSDKFALRFLTISNWDKKSEYEMDSSKGTLLVASNSSSSDILNVCEILKSSDFLLSEIYSFHFFDKPFNKIFWIDFENVLKKGNISNIINQIKKTNPFVAFAGFYHSVKM